MFKKNKNLIIKITISIVFGLLVYRYLGNSLYISSDFISNLVTFLSIIFGFYITSFSIFTTSRYVAQLYKIDDIKTGRRQSLMDTLINKYKTGLVITLISIIYILTTFFVFENEKTILLNSSIYLSLLFSFVFINFIYAFEMMGILIKVIKQTAKLNKEEK